MHLTIQAEKQTVTYIHQSFASPVPHCNCLGKSNILHWDTLLLLALRAYVEKRGGRRAFALYPFEVVGCIGR